jgi:hypothetical protein
MEVGHVQREAVSRADAGLAEQGGDLLDAPPARMPGVDVDGRSGQPSSRWYRTKTAMAPAAAISAARR